MFASTASRCSRRALARPSVWLTAAILLSGSLACDSVTGGDGPPIEGTWVTTDGSRTLYLDITASTITAYEGLQGECFYVERFDRLGRDGDRYTLRGEQSMSSFRVTLRVEDGGLKASTTAEDPTFNATFETSERDLLALDECSVLGTWVTGGAEFVEYVHITRSSLVVYWGLTGGCVSVVTYDIRERNGNVYRLVEKYSGEPLEVTLLLEGEQLAITNTAPHSQSTLYDPSDQDPSALEECGPRPSDPTIDCYGLPAVVPGDTIEGELSASDGTYSGWYYDLYGLTLTSVQEVQIGVSSDVIDSFVAVYERGGEMVIANDDTSAVSPDASVTFTGEAACYRIEASSAFVGETGPYTLTVE